MDEKSSRKEAMEREEFKAYYKKLFYAECANMALGNANAIDLRQIGRDMKRSREQIEKDLRRLQTVRSAVELFISKAVDDNYDELIS